AGPAPDMAAGTMTDVSLSVNLGVVESALYLVWHLGLMCITPDTLASLKLDLGPQLSMIGGLLPGFPAATVWTLEAKVARPPRVEGEPANAAKLAIHIDTLGADIVASLPDHTSRYLHLDIGTTLTASVVIDPASNALALEVDGAKIDSMNVDDHLGVEA